LEKREGTPLNGGSLKRAKTTPSSSTPPPGPAPAAPQLRCTACRKQGPAGKVLRCRQCQFCVHAGVCGVVVDPTTVESWLCDICSNEKTLEASLNPHCILCPRPKVDSKTHPIYPTPDNYLRSCKPTEGQAWVHTLCSVFMPEVMYSDASRLRLVEGISVVPQYRWSNKCGLCTGKGGAVVSCAECTAEFHVSCAWRCGHKFGFELQAVKASKRDTTTLVDFNEHSGCMVPLIICKGHVVHRRELHEICETNELGETALQVYCKNYKQVPTAQTHGLLRKARRLDNILNAGSDGMSSHDGDAPSGPEPRCYRCRSEFSPFFHSVSAISATNGKTAAHADAKTWMCHRCYMEQQESRIVTNGTISA